MRRLFVSFGALVYLCCGGSGPADPPTNVHQPASPPASFRVTVTVQGHGRVVSSPPGIDCSSSTCSASFDEGTPLSLKTESARDSIFGAWDGACTGSSAWCSLTVHADAQVAARFELLPVPLSASVSGPGQVTGAGMTCGNGATDCSARIAPGTAVTLRAVAAPAARFMAWGGACTGNAATCEVAPQRETAVTATFEYELQTLAANDGTNLTAFTLNSTHVFFGRVTLREGNGIWSVPKTGGTPMFVTGAIAAGLVADDSYVYWTDGLGVYSAPVQGGQASLLATGSGDLALDDEGALYWIETRGYSSSTPGAVHRTQNRVDQVLARGHNESGGIAVDATHVYFTCASIDQSDLAIRRVPKKGGVVETVLTTISMVPFVRVDSQNIYYRDNPTTAVWTVSKAGGTPRRLSSSTQQLGWGIVDLDVNGSAVWWVWMDVYRTGESGLFRVTTDGSQVSPVDVWWDAGYGWSGPRVDDKAVYYFHNGALLRRLQ